jgi:hypothetical protein
MAEQSSVCERCGGAEDVQRVVLDVFTKAMLCIDCESEFSQENLMHRLAAREISDDAADDPEAAFREAEKREIDEADLMIEVFTEMMKAAEAAGVETARALPDPEAAARQATANAAATCGISFEAAARIIDYDSERHEWIREWLSGRSEIEPEENRGEAS